ncbi:hypothetical protein HNR17_002185 [Galbitalea soli]|nr:hypothetical protein [Galbitalea soli]
MAYIDEIGETGAFVSKRDARFNTIPAFGYAGFIIPAEEARHVGSVFVKEKCTLFAAEMTGVSNPGQWERKGADIFRPNTHINYPQQIRVFTALVRKAVALGARCFFYADEKPLGTPKQTQLDPEERETAAMRETLNRLCRHADSKNDSLMVLIDQINESQRAKRLPNMYRHILGRAAERQEMLRIVEPPMHVDSVLSANIQFADWVAAAVTRAIDYQLIEDSPYSWVTGELGVLRRSFTFESKLHLHQKSIGDFTNSDILEQRRRLFPLAQGQRVSQAVDPAILRRIHGAALSRQRRG